MNIHMSSGVLYSINPDLQKNLFNMWEFNWKEQQ